MTTVDKYASSWRQEIKNQKGSGLKRFRPSSDWQIEEFKGTYNTIQYNSLLTLPWWCFSVTMRLKKKEKKLIKIREVVNNSNKAI